MPANGVAKPHIRFCTAIASANVSRPQPWSLLIGCRNRPKPCRMPIDSVRMRPVATSTTVGVRQSARAEVDVIAGCLREACLSGRRGRGAASRSRAASRSALRASAGRACAATCACARLQCGSAPRNGSFAGARQRNLARPGIPARRDGDEAALDERIELARQRGAVEQQRSGEVGHPRRCPRAPSVRSSENCVTRSPDGAIRSS